jgi:UDP-N-acetylmuramate dehydrogenase
MTQSKIENLKSKILEYEPLARYTSWKIGGAARYFANAASADDLRELVQWASDNAQPVFILGGGTNILIADGGYPGLVIRNRATQQRIEERDGRIVLWTESGAPTAGTARKLAMQGYGGLVWAEGLPGTIGGAIYGNAGCYGSETAVNLIRAWVLRDGAIEEWPKERFEHGYRTSVLKQEARGEGLEARGERLETRDEGLETGGKNPILVPSPQPPAPPIVLAAELALFRDDPGKLAAEIAAIAESRKGKTPSGSSCGSVFKNPPGTTAGRLLDQAGLKGTQVGAAIVSDKHANYIVNLGGATAADVLRLADVMRDRVLQEFGIELELEIQLVGVQP